MSVQECHWITLPILWKHEICRTYLARRFQRRFILESFGIYRLGFSHLALALTINSEKNKYSPGKKMVGSDSEKSDSDNDQSPWADLGTELTKIDLKVI